MEDENSSKLRFLFFFISAAALLGVFLLSQKTVTYFNSDNGDYFSVDSLSGADTPLAANIIGDKIGDKLVSPKLSPIMSPKPSLSPIMSPSPQAITAGVSPVITPAPVVLQSPSARPTSASLPSPSSAPVSPTPNLTPSSTPTPIATSSATPAPELTTSPRAVVINEIAWMGTSAATNDEWIELYNPNEIAVSLSGLSLKTADGGFTLSLSKSIPARGYYLIERTDNNTISDVWADLAVSFSKAGLNNSGEAVQLVNSAGQIIDEVNCSSGWFAGDNETKSSMERVDPSASSNDRSNWRSNNGLIKNGLDSKGNAINGTPGQRNSAA